MHFTSNKQNTQSVILHSILFVWNCSIPHSKLSFKGFTCICVQWRRWVSRQFRENTIPWNENFPKREFPEKTIPGTDNRLQHKSSKRQFPKTTVGVWWVRWGWGKRSSTFRRRTFRRQDLYSTGWVPRVP